MGILVDMEGAIVGLDTTPLIYFIEKNPTYHPLVKPFFVNLAGGEFSVVTSTITVVETLVHPIRQNRLALARQYREILLNAPHITTYDLNPKIAEGAAEIRANYKIRTPDAIQLATAVHAGATFFFTNDLGLLKYPHLQVVVVDKLN